MKHSFQAISHLFLICCLQETRNRLGNRRVRTRRILRILLFTQLNFFYSLMLMPNRRSTAIQNFEGGILCQCRWSDHEYVFHHPTIYLHAGNLPCQQNLFEIIVFLTRCLGPRQQVRDSEKKNEFVVPQ